MKPESTTLITPRLQVLSEDQKETIFLSVLEILEQTGVRVDHDEGLELLSGAGARTSGPLSFMDIFDAMCFTISSAGGRRGAQMATFDISHPDIIDFIKAKREDGRLRQFNLSLLM